MITCKVQMKNKIVNELLSDLGENPTTEELLQQVDKQIKEVLPLYEEMQLALRCIKSLRTELARSVQLANPAPELTEQKDKTLHHHHSVH